MEKRTRIELRIPPDEKKAADRVAKARGTDLSNMIREYLARTVARFERAQGDDSAR